MTDAMYVVQSIVWSACGLVLGYALGALLRLVWIALNRK